MSQKSQPSSDISTGNWHNTPVYSKINESPYDDSSNVGTNDNPNRDSFVVTLARLARPTH